MGGHIGDDRRHPPIDEIAALGLVHIERAAYRLEAVLDLQFGLSRLHVGFDELDHDLAHEALLTVLLGQRVLRFDGWKERERRDSGINMECE